MYRNDILRALFFLSTKEGVGVSLNRGKRRGGEKKRKETGGRVSLSFAPVLLYQHSQYFYFASRLSFAPIIYYI